MAQVTFDFTGKNILVTGASSGMGRQITLEIAKAGGHVLAVARNKERLEAVQKEAPNNIFIAVVDDIGNDELIQQEIVSFVTVHGKFSGLVYAAGIDGFTPIKAYDETLAKKIMDVSFWDAMKLVRILQKKKYTEDSASFVLFSSIAAKTGEKAMFAYSAAKAAVSTAVKTLAKEISKRGLRINAVCPGRVNTPMTAAGGDPAMEARHLLGVGNPEDISGTVLFLLSDRARWITGTDIIVDGGYLAN